MGLELFRRFFEINTATKKPKSIEDFIASKYYTTFIKFARHLMDLRPVDQGRFVDFVFRNGIKERDWCKDKIYEAYILDLLQKEPADRGVERSINTMQQWAEAEGKDFTDFFREVAPAEAAHIIKMGKLSPWVLYLAESSDSLWGRLSEEQADMISSLVDPKIWRLKFELKKEDCTFIRDLLKDFGL